MSIGIIGAGSVFGVLVGLVGGLFLEIWRVQRVKVARLSVARVCGRLPVLVVVVVCGWVWSFWWGIWLCVGVVVGRSSVGWCPSVCLSDNKKARPF